MTDRPEKAAATTLDYYEASRRRDIAAGVLQALLTRHPISTGLAKDAVELTDSLLAELSK